MNILDHDMVDAVTEVFNIGLNAASGALSELVNRHVETGSSIVEVLQPAMAVQAISELDATELVGAAQSYSGGFRGQGMLVLSARSGRNLSHMLTGGDDLPILDVLYEVTNIMLSGCFSHIADIGEVAIFQDVPRMLSGKQDIIEELQHIEEGEPVIWVRCTFNADETVINGLLCYILDHERTLLTQVQNILNRVQAG